MYIEKNDYLCSMNGMVLYKAAGSETVRRIAGRTVPYRKGLKGFIISDFAGQREIVLDEKWECDCLWCGTDEETKKVGSGSETVEKEGYGKRFAMFHKQIEKGIFRKIVLSRRKWAEGSIDVIKTLQKACSIYKDQTVALITTEAMGTWLVATPEVLLEMSDGVGRTMALAGTMKAGSGEWSEKNREEQRVVAEYIGDRLREMCDIVEEERVRTVKAGELLHLRSDFRFGSARGWEEIATALHPTPAVCGVPTRETYAFIKENEGYDRGYYSGFFGPVDERGCQLFVTLRCMEITRNGCWLYAGGGLMAESDAESEWKETENKMETIRRCIVTK